MAGGTLGRPRRFETAAALRKAVEAYFDSISRTCVVLDDEGNDVLTDDGAPVKVREFIVPPSMSGLMLSLGITRKTWSNYASSEREDIRWICERAKGIIEDYLERQLLTRQKGVQGIIFNLSANFNWREKREIEVGNETRRTLETAGMTMEEKLELIRRMAEASEDGG